MGKVNKMATEEASLELSNSIKHLKEKLGVTYRDLNIKLGRPCNTSTLQIRAAYPKKGCSIKLLNSINDSISALEDESKEVIEAEQMLNNLRDAAIEDISRVFDDYISKMKEIISEKYKHSSLEG